MQKCKNVDIDTNDDINQNDIINDLELSLAEYEREQDDCFSDIEEEMRVFNKI